MATLRTVAANALSLSAAQVLNPIAAIFLLAAIARTHGATGVGQYSLVLAIFYMAANLGALGLRTPITRAISRNRKLVSEYLGVLLVLGFAAGSIAIVSTDALVRLLDYDAEVRTSAKILSVAVIPSVWILHIEAIFIGFHQAQRTAVVSILENLAKVVGGLVLLAMGQGMVSIIVLITTLRFLALFAYVAMYFKLPNAAMPRPTWDITRELSKVAPVFATNLLLSAPFARFDFILLSKFGTMADVGLYSAALRLINVASFVPQSVKASILPAFCDALLKSKSEFLKLFRPALSYLAAYGVGAALAFITLGPVILRVIYGPKFLAADEIMRILALSLLFGSTSSALTAALFAFNKERLDLISNVSRVVAMLITLSITIPMWGLPGAGYGIVAASIVHFFLTYIFVSRSIVVENIALYYRVPAISGVIAFAFFYFFSKYSPILGGVLAITLYGTVVIILDRSIYREMMSIGKAVIGKIRP